MPVAQPVALSSNASTAVYRARYVYSQQIKKHASAYTKHGAVLHALPLGRMQEDW
jgi:hypothetical protein